MTHSALSLPASGTLQGSIGDLRRAFLALDAPPAAMLAGFYRADFIGPWWLRATGRPGVALLGLPSWQGKQFLEPLLATNIIGTGSRQRECLQMHCAIAPSTLDGRPCAVLSYDANAPRPWRWITDELRRLDEHRLLGMTQLHHPWLRAPALPFLLTRADRGVVSSGT